MSQNFKPMTGRRPLWLMAGLISLFLFTYCSSFTKLKIPKNPTQQPWSTLYQSNARQNAALSDLGPPYVILWDRKYKSVVTDQPLALENYLILSLKNGNLAVFETDEGEPLGDGRIAPAMEHAPVIVGNILYYTANLGEETMAAFDLVTRRNVWKARLPHFYTSPLIWKDRIYAGTQDGRLFCVDRHLGEVIWHFNAQSSLLGIPAEWNGQLFFCDVKSNLYCLDGTSGNYRWITPLSPNSYNGPVLAGKRLYIGTTSGIFYGLDSDTGTILWQLETGGSIYGNAAYFEGVLYVGNNASTLYAIDALEGKVVWSFQTGGIINTAPLVSQDYVYFGSWDNNLYIISRKTGEQISAIDLKRPIKSSPLLYRDRLYVQTANDRLYCIGSKNREN